MDAHCKIDTTIYCSITFKVSSENLSPSSPSPLPTSSIFIIVVVNSAWDVTSLSASETCTLTSTLICSDDANNDGCFTNLNYT